MLLRNFTIFHVVISLLGILSGFVILAGMIHSDPMEGWTRFFLWTTVLTSVTGFFFPFKRLMPSHIFGAISIVVLVAAIYARYSAHLANGWRLTFVVGAIFAQYLNVFVLVVQSFQKIPALKKIAPTQKEPPFAVAQVVVLAAFIALGILAANKFHP